MIYRRIAVVVAAAMLVVPACGDDGDAAPADGPKRIEIEMTEFAFDPDLASVVAGETVEFVVTNSGAVEHEFRLTDQAEIDAHIEGGHEEHEGDDEMGDMADEHDEGTGDMSNGDMGEMDEHPMLVVPPGETMTLTVTFPDDPSELTHFVCLIPGHYEAGMIGQIVYSG
ncbi:MAG TPA: plastocyanin/azurin family copper-binding protein [Acidimicrobiia bacterium]|nr:plastocyanin/azurin family copper-binding protein [Acidimicrobiia bacterium]